MSLARRVLVEKRRYIYPLAAALVVNALLLVFVVLPLSRKVNGGEEAAGQAAAALAAARRDFAAAQATVSGKASADVELQKFYGAVLPPDQSHARRITFKLSDMARNQNLVLDRSSTNPTHARDSALGKLTVEQTLRGQYRDIRQFIYDLETSPDFLILEHLALSQGRDAGGEIVLHLRVATYYRAGAP